MQRTALKKKPTTFADEWITTAELDDLRMQLLERERRIQQRIGGVGVQIQSLTESLLDEMDDITDDRSERVLLQLEQRDRAELEAIEAALERIKAGAYGECVLCEEPIPPARLSALPTATTCVDCAEKRQAAERSNSYPEL
jgi:RNA polymerase-binding protein DksA